MVSRLTSFFTSTATEDVKPLEDKGLTVDDNPLAIIPYSSPSSGKEEQAIVAVPTSLAGRAQPIQTKSILKILVEQVKQNPKHAAELIESLQATMCEHPESKKEFQEVIHLLEVEKQVAERHIDGIDAIEKEWLDECVMIESRLDVATPPPGYESTWLSYAVATGGAAWYVTKVSGSVLYFVCDKVLLNGKVLKLAAATGSVVSIINMVGNPTLPVMQAVVVFLFKKLIR